MNISNFDIVNSAPSETLDFRREELLKFAEFLSSLQVFENNTGCLSYRCTAEQDPFVQVHDFDSLGLDSLQHIEFVDFEAQKIEASSKTPISSAFTILHFAIYRIRQDINAIFQGSYFSFHEIAGRYEIPEFELDLPADSFDFIEAILEIAESNDFFLIRGIGFFAFGDSMQDACENFEEEFERVRKK